MKFASILAALALAISASSGFALSELEINGSRLDANGPFGFPDTITGNFTNDSEGIVDYFSFNATGGNTYSFNASVAGFGSDLAIDIENSIGSIVATKDVNGSNQGESLNYTPSSSGTYYLVIYDAFAAPSGTSYTVNASQTSGVSDWNLYLSLIHI